MSFSVSFATSNSNLRPTTLGGARPTLSAALFARTWNVLGDARVAADTYLRRAPLRRTDRRPSGPARGPRAAVEPRRARGHRHRRLSRRGPRADQPHRAGRLTDRHPA